MKIFIYLILSITFFSCFVNKNIIKKDGIFFYVSDDKIEKTRLRSTTSSEIKRLEKVRGSVYTYYLDFETFVSEDPFYQNYYLKIEYIGQGWDFINNDKLLIVCDGEKREFLVAKGSPIRYVIGADVVKEKLSWKCNEEDFRWIISAKEVIVRIYAEGGYIDTQVTEKGKVNYNKFYDTYIISKDWLKEPYRESK